jgi:hypothetical protein
VLAGKNPVFVNRVRMSSYLTSLQFFIKRFMWGQMVLQVEINACSWQHEGNQNAANPKPANDETHTNNQSKTT